MRDRDNNSTNAIVAAAATPSRMSSSIATSLDDSTGSIAGSKATLAKYVQRFRHAPAMSRIQRDRVCGPTDERSSEFWWLESSSPSEVVVNGNVDGVTGSSSNTAPMPSQPRGGRFQHGRNPWTPLPSPPLSSSHTATAAASSASTITPTTHGQQQPISPVTMIAVGGELSLSSESCGDEGGTRSPRSNSRASSSDSLPLDANDLQTATETDTMPARISTSSIAAAAATAAATATTATATDSKLLELEPQEQTRGEGEEVEEQEKKEEEKKEKRSTRVLGIEAATPEETGIKHTLLYSELDRRADELIAQSRQTLEELRQRRRDQGGEEEGGEGLRTDDGYILPPPLAFCGDTVETGPSLLLFEEEVKVNHHNDAGLAAADRKDTLANGGDILHQWRIRNRLFNEAEGTPATTAAATTTTTTVSTGGHNQRQQEQRIRPQQLFTGSLTQSQRQLLVAPEEPTQTVAAPVSDQEIRRIVAAEMIKFTAVLGRLVREVPAASPLQPRTTTTIANNPVSVAGGATSTTAAAVEPTAIATAAATATKIEAATATATATSTASASATGAGIAFAEGSSIDGEQRSVPLQLSSLPPPPVHIPTENCPCTDDAVLQALCNRARGLQDELVQIETLLQDM